MNICQSNYSWIQGSWNSLRGVDVRKRSCFFCPRNFGLALCLSI